MSDTEITLGQQAIKDTPRTTPQSKSEELQTALPLPESEQSPPSDSAPSNLTTKVEPPVSFNPLKRDDDNAKERIRTELQIHENVQQENPRRKLSPQGGKNNQASSTTQQITKKKYSPKSLFTYFKNLQPIQALGKLFTRDNANLKTNKIDTDDPEIRSKRIDNQIALQKDMSELYGHSLHDRITKIRQQIFKGIPNVQGNLVDVYRQVEVGTPGIDVYVGESRIDLYMSNLAQIIDSAAYALKELPDGQRVPAAQRLGSVLYTLALPIHPFLDGNGQTFRVAVESYLHELGGNKYAEKFFPLKQASGTVEGQDQIEVGFRDKFSKLGIMSELSLTISDKERMRRERLFRSLEYQRETETRLSQFPPESKAVERAKESIKETDQTIRNLYPDETERSIRLEESEKLLQKQESLKDNGKTVKHNLHGFYENILNSPNGENIIKQYIITGNVTPENTYQKVALENFLEVGTEIDRLLLPNDTNSLN